MYEQIKKIKEKTQDVLLQIGIPMNLSGSGYIVEAVCEGVRNPENVSSMTKNLYPFLAKTFNTNSMVVERAIRNAIAVSCDKGRLVQINKIFGVEIFLKNERPYNSEFISLLVTKIPCLVNA